MLLLQPAAVWPHICATYYNELSNTGIKVLNLSRLSQFGMCGDGLSWKFVRISLALTFSNCSAGELSADDSLFAHWHFVRSTVGTIFTMVITLCARFIFLWHDLVGKFRP